MEVLIILIIFGKIFSQILKNNKNVKQKNQSVPNQRRQQERPIQKMASTQRNSYTRHISQIRHDKDYYYQQQKNTKERLQQKYGLKQTSKSDILSRAKENVQENEADVVEQQVHEEVCMDYRNADLKPIDVEVHKRQSDSCDTAEESDILKKVNDLIVMGYSGEMNFERDFISEGVELLNRYSL